MPQVKAGKLRALAVTSLKRWAILPDVPTIAEAGVPGYESTVWHGVLLPANVRPALVTQLHREIAEEILKTREVREAFAAQWLEPLGTTPQAFAAFLKEDIARSMKIVKAAGISAR
jgi:tripartite-type tricarboxylate transporter receptor subunit TctC